MARSGGFEALLEAMPPADFAMAYGSGVFAQAGYESAFRAPTRAKETRGVHGAGLQM